MGFRMNFNKISFVSQRYTFQGNARRKETHIEIHRRLWRNSLSMCGFTFMFLLILSSLTFAETTNTTSYWNITAVTGLTGTTYAYCNTTANCGSYTCFLDWDSASAGGYIGWCNATSITNCYHNDTAYSSSYSECASTTIKRICSSGTWTTETCSSACSGGTCTATTTTTTTIGSSTGSTTFNTTYTTVSSIKLVSSPADFNIVQNETTFKTVEVKNNGTKALLNMSLKLSGIDSNWFSIIPDKFKSTPEGTTNTFMINISVPADAEIKTYVISINAVTSNESVYVASSFSMKVLPNSKTIKTDIIPRFLEYQSLIPVLEKNVTNLKQKGVDTSLMESILNNLKSKMNQVDSDIKSQDNFAAKQNLDEAKNLISNLNSRIDSAVIPVPLMPKMDFTLYIIAAAVVVSGILLYLFWPVK